MGDDTYRPDPTAMNGSSTVDPEHSTSVDPDPTPTGQLLLADRFMEKEALGFGASGTVIRAFDRVRRHDVALKFLHTVDPDTLYRFKQEFRSLVGIVHPNIVSLYELVVIQGRWVVVMELVDGARSFIEYVRPHQGPSRGASMATRDGIDAPPQPADQKSSTSGQHSGDTQIVTPTHGQSSAISSIPPELTPTRDLGNEQTAVIQSSITTPSQRQTIIAAPLDLNRLGPALAQLIEGLDTVHQCGLLHRDIKPSNVLVDRTGRVIVCDFGLVASERHTDTDLVGTPAYMSPEQTCHGPLTTATDLYSVGVMLYEALTGRRPTTGKFNEQELSPYNVEIIPPRFYDPEIDPQLESLCLELLDTDPTRRPTAAQVRASAHRFAPVSTDLSTVEPFHSTPLDNHFIGREQERTELHQAFRDSRSGQTVAVLLSGLSGVGKSALMKKVCDELGQDDNALVFSGRCYQSESVPFKALDAVIDAISIHLLSLPVADVIQCIPGDDEIAALSQLFPVLRRSEPVDLAVERYAQELLPHLLPSLAQAGLHKLLRSLATMRPIIITIDDLQWGDLDSEPLLREIIEGPGSPGILLLATCRPNSEHNEQFTSSQLITTLSQPSLLGVHHDVRRIEVEPLGNHDATALLTTITNGRPLPRSLVTQLIRDAAGHPMFVIELAHSLRAGESTADINGLDPLIQRRIEALPPDSRALLEATATAAWPQPVSLLSKALELNHEASTLAQLLALRMIRMVHGSDGERIMTYHDRVRHVAMRCLGTTRRRELHEKLALAFESRPIPDGEALAMHWAEAGNKSRASYYALTAGRRALTNRAYRRAADHFERALNLGQLDHATRDRIEVERAEALFLAGSLRLAAKIFRRVAHRVSRHEAVRLRGRALICLLRSGEVQRAQPLIRVATRDVGLKIPQSKFATLVSLGWNQLIFAVHKPRIRRLLPPKTAPAATERRLDLAKSVSTAISKIDPLLGYAIQTQYVRDALHVGDPIHLTHALSQQASFAALIYGKAAQAKVTSLLTQAAQAAQATGRDAYQGLVQAQHGYYSFYSMTRFRDGAEELAHSAERMVQEPDLLWQSDNSRQFSMSAYCFAGEFGLIADQFHTLLKRTAQSGNEALHNDMSRSSAIYIYFAHDKPDLGRQLLERVRPSATRHPTVEHWGFESLQAQLESYLDDWPSAATRINRLFDNIVKYAAGRVPLFGCVSAGCAARMNAVMAVRAPHHLRADYLARVKVAGSRFTRLKANAPEYAEAHLSLVEAFTAIIHGDRQSTINHLHRAVDGFGVCQARLHQMPARYELGRLIGGDQGQALMDEVRAWMEAQGVVNPERFIRWQCPISILEPKRGRFS